MIVITAPTGQIGRHVVQRLLAAGAPLCLIARDASKLPGGVRDQVESSLSLSWVASKIT